MQSYPHNPQVILASGSATRRVLLTEAGILFQAHPSQVDEKRIKAHHPDLDAAEMAMLLAAAKARQISAEHPACFVIGCDQMLDCDGVWLEKPETMEAVRDSLTRLAGRRHRLITAAVIMRDAQIVWAQTDVNWLKIKPLTADEIEAYVREKGAGVLGCLGGFKIEESLDLFDEINGTIDSIRGLPMASLTAFLSEHMPAATKK